MANYHFEIGSKYTKNDIYNICEVPAAKQKGNWNTGYTNYDGDWFIFCNIGVPGRTGHDYQNRFVGNDLVWYGKTKSSVEQESIRSMFEPQGNIYIFFREEDRAPFSFAGKATVKSHKETVPVEITWTFVLPAFTPPELLPEEISEPDKFFEGATKTIAVNVYERNQQARKTCIARYGASCSVCGFNFSLTYGEIGEGFIHIHHLKQLADIGVEYELDPIEDLRPVCPNCHAMLHRRRPAYSIDELQNILKATN